MGLLSILLASLLVSRHGERRGSRDDLEKAQQQEGPTAGDGDEESELQIRSPGTSDHVDDDSESIQDSDAQDVDEDEPEGTPAPERRVTFGAPSGESTPPPEKAGAKPGRLARLKAIVFPPKDEDKHLANYRVLPVISGLVIPFSILLEIPGLISGWYIRTDANVVVETRRNPPLLEAGLALSMFFAVVANVSLICRFLEKGTVLVTTLITIASLTIHDLINIPALIVFGVEHRFSDGFTYGQGYWMTACSTIVSSATNLTLIWDLFRTPNFSKSGSGVSHKQRSLLVIVMLLLVYIAFGALVNSFLIGLDFINGLYFTVVSIETVGFGDIVPDNTSSRVFMCFYIVFGILNLGVAVGVARETIFEQLQISYRKRLARIRQNYREHRRWRTWERKWKRAVKWRLEDMSAAVWIPDHEGDSDSMMEHPKEGSKWTLLSSIARFFPISLHNHEHYKYFQETGEIRGISYGHPGTHLNVEGLSHAQLEAAAVESGVPQCVLRSLRRHVIPLSRTHSTSTGSCTSVKQRWRRWFWSVGEPLQTELPTTPVMRGLEDMAGMLTKFAFATTGVGMNRLPLWGNPVSHGIRPQRHLTIDSSFSESTSHSDGPFYSTEDDLREITDKEERKAFWAKLIVAWTLFMVFWLVGAALFVVTEKWTYGIAVYFCFITFTTTGYGDYSPQTAAGRSVFVFWALLGLATMTILVSVLQDVFSSKYKSALHSGAFENAVKKYRQKTKAESEKRPQETNGGLSIPVRVHTSVVKESSSRAQKKLESLPTQVLEHAGIFHRHVQYFLQPELDRVIGPDLKLVLDDIARAQKLDERVKDEILEDEDARNTLSMLSFERALQDLINVAESTLSTLSERDLVAARYREQRVKEGRNLQDQASGSGVCHYDPPHGSDVL